MRRDLDLEGHSADLSGSCRRKASSASRGSGTQGRRGPWGKCSSSSCLQEGERPWLEIASSPKQSPAPRKGHTRNPLSNQFQDSGNPTAEKFLGLPDSHLPAFKPVFFYSVLSPRTFRVFGDSKWVSTATSSWSLFCILFLWAVSCLSTLKRNGGGRNLIQFFNNGLISTAYTRKMTSGFLHHCDLLEGRTKSDSSLYPPQ